MTGLPEPIRALMKCQGQPFGSGFYFPRHDKATIAATLRAASRSLRENGSSRSALTVELWADQIEKKGQG